MVEFKFFDNAGAFRKGRQFRNQQQDRNALMQAGHMASEGDFAGARNSALSSGLINAAIGFQGFEDAKTNRHRNDRALVTKENREKLGRMINVIGSAQNEQQFENAKIFLKSQGIADDDDLAQIGGFQNRDFFVSQFTPYLKRMDLTLKEHEFKLKNRQFDLKTKEFERASKNTNNGLFKDHKQKVDVTSKLRTEFTSLAKTFRGVRDAATRVEASAHNPSAAGDLAMIFNFMKVLDPGSTVREGEFATAQNSSGIPERLRAQYNSIINGERLSNVQRDDFLNRSRVLAQRQSDQFAKTQKQFEAIVKRQGIDPQDVIIDFTTAAKQQEQTGQRQNKLFDDVSGIPEGRRFRDNQTGKIYIKRNGQIEEVQ